MAVQVGTIEPWFKSLILQGDDQAVSTDRDLGGWVKVSGGTTGVARGEELLPIRATHRVEVQIITCAVIVAWLGQVYPGDTQ